MLTWRAFPPGVLALLAMACESKPTSGPPRIATTPADASASPDVTASAPAASVEPDPAVIAPMTSASTPTVPIPSSEKAKLLATGSNAFAIDLWGRVGREAKGNLVISPASLSLALAMTYGGAGTETAAQMKRVLHFEDGPGPVLDAWGGLGRSLSNPARSTKLRMANRLFGERSYTFGAPYLARTRAAVGAPLEPLDFVHAPDPSRLRINAWVFEETGKRIADLLAKEAITSLTRLVLVNAISFLGDWAQPFDPAQTRNDTFFTSATTKKSVPMMQRSGPCAIGRVGGARVLELPYKGNDASLFVIVPEKVDGLPAIESSLSWAGLESWKRSVTPKEALLTMPRFEVAPTRSIPLSTALAALGMPLAFDPAKADFTAIGNPPNPSERLHVADVFHKAFVKVDEKGTEAAAATGVVMSARGIAEPPAPFAVDRPFLFFIVERPSGLVLFMGRVVDP